jgi:hypothetical protein
MLCRSGWLGLLALVLVPVFSWGAARTPQEQKDIEARLKRDVSFLASPACEGRGPTTKGINRAADYIAEQFKKAGLKPGNPADYFQPFRIAGAQGSLTLVGPQGQKVVLQRGMHFIPLGHDQEGTVTAPVAFAGYGIATKDYDDYAGLDAKDKVLVILHDTPRPGTARRPPAFAPYLFAPFTTKLTQAQRKGAKAVLFIHNANTAQDNDAPLDYSYSRVGRVGKRLPAFFARRDVLEKMLPASQSLRTVEQGIDRDLKPNSFDLTGWKVEMEVERKNDLIGLKNVVGVLDGAGPLADETVVVGAHYDHLGYGGPSSMSASKRREIHHGADDNGSGTTAMLELARRFSAMKNRQGRRLVFLAFSGEELGLFGSQHYCKQPLFPLAKTVAMYNLDMIGRLRPDPRTGKGKLLTEGHGTAAPFKELIDSLAKKYDLTLTSKASGIGPSDHASFCEKRVPVIFVWTGDHPDYHRPSDTADRINYPGMCRIIDLSEEAITALTRMEKPAFVEVKGATGMRPSSGPRLGIRPGYGGDTAGVAVEGVTLGGPAERGGVKNGDVIVGLAGKPVKDLQTYMVVMKTQKRGNSIEVEVVRQGKKVKLQVKLE